MPAIPRSHKIFYGVICAAALLIGFLGYFAPAMFVFTALVLLASIIHRDLFSISELSDLIWFIAFGVETVFLGLITYRVLTEKQQLVD